MSQTDYEADPLVALAEEFADRYRRGERPALTEYAARHPELAERIRRLFPAMIEIEDIGSGAGRSALGGPVATSGPVPQQLGEYRIFGEIGRGGMGIVYEALQESLGRHVALKVLPHHRLMPQTQLERFRREARAAARLHHTNIVPVFGVGECGGVHYYAMQFIRGQNLDSVLRELRRLRDASCTPPVNDLGQSLDLSLTIAQELATGQFSCSEADRPNSAQVPRVESAPSPSGSHSDLGSQSDLHYYRGVAQIGMQIADGLAYAHAQGVLHRDIKPSNILLDTQGTAWIADFGLAKVEGLDELTSQGDIVGTLRYMAPEQFRGEATERGDVYGLGLTLYELLTLRPAFAESERAQLIERVLHEEPPRPRGIDRRVPRDLETIVFTAIAKEPGQRYAAAAALAEDLRRFLAGRPIRARRAPAWERTWLWCRRNPAVAGLLALVTTLLVTIAVGSLVSAARLAKNLRRAEDAERDAQRSLWGSYLAQARAHRYSGRPGQRFDGLDALAKAAHLDAFPGRQGELREEAISCLALTDLRPLRPLVGQSLDEYRVAFDATFTHYAVSDADCNVSVRRVVDDVGVARLPRIGPLPRVSWVVLRFSLDGRKLAVGYDFDAKESSVCVFDLSGDTPVLETTLNDASLFDFSPDGRRLAVGRSDGTIGLFDASSGQEQGRFETGFPAPHRHYQFAFRPDGRQVAVNSRTSHAVHLVDIDSGSVVARLEHPTTTHKFAWRGDGRRLAVGCDDHRIDLWDPTTPDRPLARLVGHEDNGLSVAFSRGGDFLVSTAWDDTTRLWDPERARPLLREVPGNFLAVNADGDRVALRRSNRLEVWELASGRECRPLPHSAESVDFRADGRLLVTAGQDAVCWDVALGREMTRLPAGPNVSATFRPVGDELITFGQESGLLRWPAGADAGGTSSANQFGPPHIFKLQGGADVGNERTCWSADGGLLAVVDGAQRDVVILDGASGAERKRLRSHPTSPPLVRIALSPDGRWAAVGHHQGQSPYLPAVVTVWEVDSGQLTTLRGSLPGDHVAFSPDGRWFVVGGVGDYRFYRVGTWQAGPVLLRDAGESTPGPLAFARDGGLLAIARTLSDVELIDPTTGRALATLRAPEPRQVSWLCFSPDCNRLAVATTGDHVQLWDLRLIRKQLAALGLAWDLPSNPP